MPVTTYTTIDGEIVSQDVNGTVHDLLPDPLGHTVALLGSGQGIEFEYNYWPYEEIGSIEDVATALRYVGTLGYYSDDYGSPRVYVRARHYRGPYGRWLTVDPLWPEEEAYLFVGDNPMSMVDPNGTDPGTCNALYYDCMKCRRFFITRVSHGRNLVALIGTAGAMIGLAGGSPPTKGVAIIGALCVGGMVATLQDKLNQLDEQMEDQCKKFLKSCLVNPETLCDGIAKKRCFGLSGAFYVACYAKEFSDCIIKNSTRPPTPTSRPVRFPGWVYNRCRGIWKK